MPKIETRSRPIAGAGLLLMLALASCQGGAAAFPDPTPAPIPSAEVFPSPASFGPGDAGPTPSSPGEPVPAVQLPPGFLADPNTICVFYLDQVLSCLDQEGWATYPDEVFVRPLSIPYVLAVCADGRRYLALSNRVYQLVGEDLLDLGEAYEPFTIACGPGEQVWMADWDGVSQYDGAAWTRYPSEEIFGEGELVSPVVNAMAITPKGEVWLASYDAIATFDGADWQLVTPPGGYVFLDFPGRGLISDLQGNLWVATGSDEDGQQHLLQHAGGLWTEVAIPSYPLGDLMILTLDQQDRLWAASSKGKIFMYDPQAKVWQPQFEGKLFGARPGAFAIRALHFDLQNRLWLTTDYGLEVFEGSAWTSYRIDNADIYGNDMYALFVLGDGPPLAPLAEVPRGSISGRLVNQAGNDYANALGELCLSATSGWFPTGSPCAEHAFHALTTVNADGSFMFVDVPVGTYYLVIRPEEDAPWSSVIDKAISNYANPGLIRIDLDPGEDIDLGNISTDN